MSEINHYEEFKQYAPIRATCITCNKPLYQHTKTLKIVCATKTFTILNKRCFE